ncbi:Cell division cycle protein 123 [Balamuthia mandrillaris]
MNERRPPKIFDTLQQLFDITDDEAEFVDHPGFSPEDYHRLPIPICQHNIYKLSPFTFEKKDEAKRYAITFPESKLSLLESLSPSSFPLLWEQLREVQNYPPKCEEEVGQRVLQVDYVVDGVANAKEEESAIEDLKYQLYLSHVNKYNLEEWSLPLQHVFTQSNTAKEDGEETRVKVLPKTQLVALTEEEVRTIEELHERSSYGRYLAAVMHQIHQFAKTLEDRMNGPFFKKQPEDGEEKEIARREEEKKPFFFKLNTRSPKDSSFYKEQNVFAMIRQQRRKEDEEEEEEEVTKKRKLEKCQAYNAVDVICGLVGSTRIYEDCKSFRQWKVKPHLKPPLQLVMQEWVTFDPEFEFRCFIFQGRLNAINQLCWQKYIPELAEDKALQQNLIDAVKRLQSQVHPLLPFENYILDIVYHKEADVATIVEFNPWGPYSCTGSQLFSWELDWDVLFGKNKQDEGVVLRLLRKGMKVIGGFHLYYSKKRWQPSEAFLEGLEKSTKRCPCCRYPSDPFR